MHLVMKACLQCGFVVGNTSCRLNIVVVYVSPLINTASMLGSASVSIEYHSDLEAISDGMCLSGEFCFCMFMCSPVCGFVCVSLYLYLNARACVDCACVVCAYVARPLVRRPNGRSFSFSLPRC